MKKGNQSKKKYRMYNFRGKRALEILMLFSNLVCAQRVEKYKEKPDVKWHKATEHLRERFYPAKLLFCKKGLFLQQKIMYINVIQGKAHFISH